ncbi:hypothetical protein ABL78_7165 [Leptomonas seymouri]|uniref:GOLD domain-containing protein n=1 Tax=Leptomonas seymouri TaxID=5684 RepID=A0A0N1PA81_LEPSE|nr:hypothetical protein ABL78_7165 [Leptomonas seymouri]|eukprot:KPI83783.1 hypothetical protein ABL78_7165 [Leptomonas seymouri]
MGCLRLLVVCALTTLLLSTVPAYSIFTSVDPGEVFLVEEVVPPGHILMFSFQQDPDFLFTVSVKDGHNGIVLRLWRDEVSGVMAVKALDEKMTYQFLFDNSNAVLTAKSVDFGIRVVLDPEYNIEKGQLDPIEVKIRSLSAKFQKMKSLQLMWRYQQSQHRATVEDVNERVLLWSILQIVGFVICAGGQIFMLKFFLEKGRSA